MLLTDIKKQVRPLSGAEKRQLIRDIQEMLMQEESPELQNILTSGETYPLFTPVGLENGAEKLQQYLQEGRL